MTMIDSIQDDDDLYAQLKGLQRQEEFLDIQEEYIKDEMRNLKREFIRAREVSALLIN
jgi:26S proteasome regulatory subunit T3